MSENNDSAVVPMQSLAKIVLEPTNIKDAMELAKVLCNSDLVPREMKGKPADILIAIGFGQSIGLSWAQAVTSIFVVNGRPSIFGDAALAAVRQSGKLAQFTELDPEKALENGGGLCIVKRSDSGEVVERRFTVEAAKKANLWGKAGPWSAYPGRMLMFRARSWALRDAFGDVLKGLTTVEEARDIINTTATRESLPPIRQPQRTPGASQQAQESSQAPVEGPPGDRNAASDSQPLRDSQGSLTASQKAMEAVQVAIERPPSDADALDDPQGTPEPILAEKAPSTPSQPKTRIYDAAFQVEKVTANSARTSFKVYATDNRLFYSNDANIAKYCKDRAKSPVVITVRYDCENEIQEVRELKEELNLAEGA